MRVAVDGSRLLGQRLGVGRYIEYLLASWATQATASDEIILYVPSQLPDEETFVRPPVEVKVAASRMPGYLWQTLVLAPRARSADVLFGPSYRLPLSYRHPAVVAIHSVNEAHQGAYEGAYRFTHAQAIKASARRARRIVVPSQSTLVDVQEAYGVSREKITVVPQAADDAFRPTADSIATAAVRERYFGDAATPFVLWVGKLSRRRNLPLLIESFARACRERGLPHHLLLFGPNHLGLPLAELAERFGVADRVVQTDGIVQDHRELVAIYNAADLYVNASSYEGFSMTLVEALACGVPVVAVDQGGVGETARGAALLVEEPSVELLAGAIGRVLTDPEAAASLRARGAARGAEYNWARVAQATLDVLRDAANGSARR
jgi:glycosyltransferase involved in cell wall biosynthesis